MESALKVLAMVLMLVAATLLAIVAWDLAFGRGITKEQQLSTSTLKWRADDLGVWRVSPECPVCSKGLMVYQSPRNRTEFESDTAVYTCHKCNSVMALDLLLWKIRKIEAERDGLKLGK